MNLVLASISVIAALAMISSNVPYLPVPHDAAVMLVTSSTNTVGYRIVVQRNGDAEYVRGNDRATAHLSPAATTQLFSDLETGMPLSALPAKRCMKSASFGTSTFVYWRHQRSPDVSCPGDAKGAAIEADVARVATELKLTQPVMRTNATSAPTQITPQPSPTM